MASPQPIALPSSSSPQHEYHTASGSYSGGSFNPASYTRHFLGSPISWRAAGSFGSRFYPGSSPGQLLGPLDPNDFKTGKLSSSMESDRGSILNTRNVFEREDEMCRNFTCCGLQLNDLHALLEHFEEVHIVVVDPYSQPQQSHPHLQQHPQHTNPAYFNVSSSLHQQQFMQQPQPQPQQQQAPQHHNPPSYPPPPAYAVPFDPDDMELEFDSASLPSSGAPSPPDTPISTPLSAYPPSAFDTTAVLPNRARAPLGLFPPAHPPHAARIDAFNAYAGYSDFSASMPGTVPCEPNVGKEPGSPYAAGVHPALLFSSTGTTPANTPETSRVPSPTPPSTANTSAAPSPVEEKPSQASPRASTTLSRPASSLLLAKPFRCPKPNCNKSYKQANGLKYHMTHGSCNFAPPPALDLDLGGGEEAVRELERRLRPFACGVGECQRRYKNMNGLRYHYAHSGEHGSIGLRLLASGQHECLMHANGRNVNAGSGPASRQGTPAASGATTPVHQQQPQFPPQQVQAQAQAQEQQAIQMAYAQQQQQRQYYQQISGYGGMSG